MMRYLLDTNICIYIMNHHPAEVLERFRQFEVGDIGVSSITAAELYYGASKSAHPRRNRQRVMEFLLPFEVAPFDENAAATYGELRHELERAGQPIGPLDLLIAAHALSNGWILVTNNQREFSRVPGLQVENWVGSS